MTLLAAIDGMIPQLVLLLVVALITWLAKRATEAERKRRGQEQAELEQELEPARQEDPPRRQAPRAIQLSDYAPQTSGQPRGAGSGPVQGGTIGDVARRRQAVRHLLTAGAQGASRRDLVRTGILWSEILGPPRAHRGSHRESHRPRRSTR